MQNYLEHLRTFCKIETGGEGGCGNFQVVSQRQNMSTFYFALVPYFLVFSFQFIVLYFNFIVFRSPSLGFSFHLIVLSDKFLVFNF